MNRFFRFAFVVAAALPLGACNNSEIDDLEKDIDAIYGRLEAVETQVKALNSNVEALQTLMQGATINKVEEKDGTYTVTLSNGDVITLTQGSAGGYLTPVVSVDEEGYWVVSTDGTTFTRILDSQNQPVKAVAKDGTDGDKGDAGITPMFKVDENGYWMVSYDKGANYVQVLDPDGKPVDATQGSAQDKFFASVVPSDDKLTVTLLSGQTLEIPIMANFKCVIDNKEEIVYFDQKQTRAFAVEMLGVAETIVVAPEGWTAVLAAKGEGHELSVTAPVDKTRAVADSRIDVAILAIAGNGLSSISKMQVALTTTVLHTPEVSAVTVNEAATTETSLSFTVTTSDANGWKYICKPATEAAPTAEEVYVNGTAGAAEGATVVTGLTHTTNYAIYVVAHYDATVGATVAKAEARTAKGLVDYYESGVTLGGVTYSKNTAGAQLVTATTEIGTDGVYFLDPADGATITIKKMTAKNLVIIGRHSNKRVTVNMIAGANFISLGDGNGLIFKNIHLDASNQTNYSFNFASGTFTTKNFIVEDSKITLPATKALSYFSNNNARIENVHFKYSIIQPKSSADGNATRIINFAGGKIADNGKVHIENCAFVTNGHVTDGALVWYNNDNLTTPTVDYTVENCTFVNFVGRPNGYFFVANAKNITFRKNIMWSQALTTESFTLQFRLADQSGITLDYKDNLAYGLADNNMNCWKYYHASTKYNDAPDSENTAFAKESTDPLTIDFATDTFKSNVDGYGADLD